MSKISPEILSSAAEALMAGDVSSAIRARKSDGTSLFDEPSLAQELDFILTRTPQVLADCPPHYLAPLRVETALMVLFGISSIRNFISVDGDYSYKHAPEAVAHLLSSHAAYLVRRAQMADSGIKNVQMLSAGLPEECAVCRNIPRRFGIAEVPELPLADCTCPDYCKCVLIAIGVSASK